MAFDPNWPTFKAANTSAKMREQLNGLNGQITDERARLDAASAALDWSNGAPKLPDYTTIAAPVLGNFAFNYSSGHLMVFDGADWCQV
jgi:hypothetical protein